MPGNIERRKRQAVLSALVNGCWLVLSAVVVLWLRQLLQSREISWVFLLTSRLVNALFMQESDFSSVFWLTSREVSWLT